MYLKRLRSEDEEVFARTASNRQARMQAAAVDAEIAVDDRASVAAPGSPSSDTPCCSRRSRRSRPPTIRIEWDRGRHQLPVLPSSSRRRRSGAWCLRRPSESISNSSLLRLMFGKPKTCSEAALPASRESPSSSLPASPGRCPEFPARGRSMITRTASARTCSSSSASSRVHDHVHLRLEVRDREPTDRVGGDAELLEDRLDARRDLAAALEVVAL